MKKLEKIALIIVGIELVTIYRIEKSIKEATKKKMMENYGTTDPEKALAIMNKMEQVKKAQ